MRQYGRSAPHLAFIDRCEHCCCITKLSQLDCIFAGMTQIIDKNLRRSDRLTEPADHIKTEGNTENDLISREYFHLPAVDIRVTAHWFYFDIELPGVTKKAGISIQWISVQSFVVKGEIPRPRISTRDDLDDNSALTDWKKSAETSLQTPSGLDSLNTGSAQKDTNTVIKESVAPHGDIIPKPKDNYPGFPHLLRCPASGSHHDQNDRTTDALPTDSQLKDNQQVPKLSKRPSAPMDEIELIHSRSISFKNSSPQRKPHNDHDFQSATHPFGFLSNHNEHQSPQYVVREYSTDSAATPPISREQSQGSFTTSNDILLPINNDSEPQLLVAERQIGTYKRRCTVPGNGSAKVHVERTEAKLEAGVLTVRVPRKLDAGRSDEASELSCGWKVFVE